MTPAELRARALACDAKLARQKADRLRAEARAATRKAVLGLLAEGISLRDAALILGVSHQRVHQIARAPT